ncbi:hypothetical protein [Nocardia sp. alder85J]|uniref:hypothetical protein n=1 Tax=Nocardia sp. alder85J TaxID=2862949 RepID=UPI001CD572DA|nr:hypothetical protein [Nocardia sp. alder85J]MCX4094485.1 hypothetical protein [Nocardia sp. alder85J]
MIHWLAADPAPQSNNGSSGSPGPWWLPYLALVAPLTAPFIAGLFSMRTTRKTPHEKLEKLIGVVNNWPEDLPGKETVYQSIELTLGEIREVDKLGDLPKVEASETPSESSNAEEQVDAIVQARAAAQATTQRLGLGLMMAAFGLVFLALGAVATARGDSSAWPFITIGGGYVALALLLAFDPGGFGEFAAQLLRAIWNPMLTAQIIARHISDRKSK